MPSARAQLICSLYGAAAEVSGSRGGGPCRTRAEETEDCTTSSGKPAFQKSGLSFLSKGNGRKLLYRPFQEGDKRDPHSNLNTEMKTKRCYKEEPPGLNEKVEE